MRNLVIFLAVAISLLAARIGHTQAGPPAAPTSATLTFVANDGGPWTRAFDNFLKSEARFWSHGQSAALVSGVDDGRTRTALVRFPDIVGTATGQIPDGATIVSATLSLRAMLAKNESIAVQRIIEPWAETPSFYFGGAANAATPSWAYRLPGMPWSTEGCGSASHGAALDTRTITQSETVYTWNVAAAVQTWAYDRTANHGLALDNRTNSKAQAFYSSDSALPNVAPVLTVTYALRPDSTSPELLGSIPQTSPVFPVFVEGTIGADALDPVIATFCPGTAVASTVRRVAAKRWYADICVDPLNATIVEISARDQSGNFAQLSGLIEITPTDLAAATQSITLRRHDGLLLTDSRPGAAVSIDVGNGSLVPRGTPGTLLPHTFDTAGVFVVRTRVDRLPILALTVVVVDAQIAPEPACEIGFARYIESTIQPSAQAGAVAIEAGDPSLVAVGPLTTTTTGVRFKARPLDHGRLLLLTRLAPSGPILAETEIREYWLSADARRAVAIDPASGDALTPLVMRPYIPGLLVTLRMFGSTSTFPGGLTTLALDTSSDFVEARDDAADESMGISIYPISIPPGEWSYCHTIAIEQLAAPTDEGAGEATNNANVAVNGSMTDCLCQDVTMTIAPTEVTIAVDECGTFTVTVTDMSMKRCSGKVTFDVVDPTVAVCTSSVSSSTTNSTTYKVDVSGKGTGTTQLRAKLGSAVCSTAAITVFDLKFFSVAGLTTSGSGMITAKFNPLTVTYGGASLSAEQSGASVLLGSSPGGTGIVDVPSNLAALFTQGQIKLVLSVTMPNGSITKRTHTIAATPTLRQDSGSWTIGWAPPILYTYTATVFVIRYTWGLPRSGFTDRLGASASVAGSPGMTFQLITRAPPAKPQVLGATCSMSPGGPVSVALPIDTTPAYTIPGSRVFGAPLSEGPRFYQPGATTVDFHATMPNLQPKSCTVILN